MLICECCGEECGTKVADFGYGPYSYGSIESVHHDYQECSDCCESDVVEAKERKYTVRASVHKSRKTGKYYELTVIKHWIEDPVNKRWIETHKNELSDQSPEGVKKHKQHLSKWKASTNQLERGIIVGKGFIDW